MYPLYKKYARTMLDIALIAVSVFLILFLFSLFYQIAAPIFFGLIIYIMIEPLAAWLHRRGMKKPTASLISVLVFIIVTASVLVIAGMIFTLQIQQLANSITINSSEFKASFKENLDLLQAQFEALPPEIVAELQTYVGKLVSYGSEFVSSFLLWMFSMVTSLPTLLFNFVIGLILAFYLSSEINLWRDWAKEKVPNSIKSAAAFLRENVFSGILSYMRSQLKLVSFTFVIVFIGLLFMGMKNAFSIAVLAAIFDVLPILGIPVIFVPWIVYCLIVGEVSMAIYLTVLFLVAFFTRQILEPKISGQSIGVSAFTMLACIVISLSLFGVAGVIITPFLVILIKALYDHGYFRKWIHLPEDEFADSQK
jgi:sporulation integral membrane protein YtvI